MSIDTNAVLVFAIVVFIVTMMGLAAIWFWTEREHRAFWREMERRRADRG